LIAASIANLFESLKHHELYTSPWKSVDGCLQTSLKPPKANQSVLEKWKVEYFSQALHDLKSFLKIWIFSMGETERYQTYTRENHKKLNGTDCWVVYDHHSGVTAEFHALISFVLDSRSKTRKKSVCREDYGSQNDMLVNMKVILLILILTAPSE